MVAEMHVSKDLTAFAFSKHNISTRTLYGLKDIDSRNLVFGKASIEKYMKFLLSQQPKYILGFGIYTGRDKDKIRIETICTNKFRNRFIEGHTLQTIKINTFLQPYQLSKYTHKIGNSYCNLVSWNIMKLIQSDKLLAKYTFLHLPKTMSVDDTIPEIQQMLDYYFKKVNQKT